MTNLPWRRMRHIAITLMEEMRNFELSTEINEELSRIEKLVDEEEYTVATPRIFAEAPELDFSVVDPVVAEKYDLLMGEASKFKVLK